MLSGCHIVVNNIITSIAYERLVNINTKNFTAYITVGIVFIEASSTYFKISSAA